MKLPYGAIHVGADLWGKREAHERDHKTALSFLRLQPTAHKYCSWSPHNREVTIQLGLQQTAQSFSDFNQPPPILCWWLHRLSSGRKRNRPDTTVNERATETNYAREAN